MMKTLANIGMIQTNKNIPKWDIINLEFANSEAAHNVKHRANRNIIARLLEKVQELLNSQQSSTIVKNGKFDNI